MPERRIYSRLAGSTGVTSLLAGGRSSIRPVMVGQGQAMPYLVYSRIDSVPLNTSTGYTSSQTARIQIDTYSQTYSGARQVATAVRESLRGWGSSTGSPVIDMTHQAGEQDLSEPVEPGQDAIIHRVSQDFLIDYTTT